MSIDKRTVLVVDDETTILKIIHKMLELHKHTVITASSGQIAIDLIQTYEGKIDYMILDLSMPGMSGAQTFEIIHKDYPELKVIISSGFGKTPETLKFIDMGATAILAKPFEMKELIDLIK